MIGDVVFLPSVLLRAPQETGLTETLQLKRHARPSGLDHEVLLEVHCLRFRGCRPTGAMGFLEDRLGLSTVWGRWMVNLRGEDARCSGNPIQVPKSSCVGLGTRLEVACFLECQASVTDS